MGVEKKFCCQLAEAVEEERMLVDTGNFFVIPALGSIEIEGYLLVVPKHHYHAIAQVPDNLQAELNELLKDLRGLISSEYHLQSLIFEHGPRVGSLDSGQSIDHAHLHVVPGVDITECWAKDLMSRLEMVGQHYTVERVEGFQRARELLDFGKSYLYISNPDEKQLMSEQSFHRPSQYFRAMVASKIGSKKWDWRQYPDNKTLEKTVIRLRGKL